MNINQMINVFNLDPYMSKYKIYSIPLDFLEHIQSVNKTLIIVNSSPSTVKTGQWLCIFQTTKNIEFFLSSWPTAYILQASHANILTVNFLAFMVTILD